MEIYYSSQWTATRTNFFAAFKATFLKPRFCFKPIMWDIEMHHVRTFFLCVASPGGAPYNGLYGEAPPERGTFFRLQVYKRVGISQVEVYKRVEKSII